MKQCMYIHLYKYIKCVFVYICAYIMCFLIEIILLTEIFENKINDYK